MLYLAIFFIVFTIIILLLKINPILHYKLTGLDDRGSLGVSMFGGRITVKIKLPLFAGKKKEKNEFEMDFLNGIYDKYNNLKEIYEIFNNVKMYLRKKLSLKELKIRVDFGAGDACYTGIVGGFVWASIGMATSFLAATFKPLKKFKPYIKVNPDFTEMKFDVEVNCIFSIRIVHIIIVGLKLLFFYLKNKKGGVLFGRSSNRRFNEDSYGKYKGHG